MFAADGGLERGVVVPGTRFEVGERVGRWYSFWCCVDAGFAITRILEPKRT